jgi:hypothetical protein
VTVANFELQLSFSELVCHHLVSMTHPDAFLLQTHDCPNRIKKEG